MTDFSGPIWVKNEAQEHLAMETAWQPQGQRQGWACQVTDSSKDINKDGKNKFLAKAEGREVVKSQRNSRSWLPEKF